MQTTYVIFMLLVSTCISTHSAQNTIRTNLPQHNAVLKTDTLYTLSEERELEREHQLDLLDSVSGEATKVSYDMRGKVAILLARKDYDGLDKLAEGLRASKKMTAKGRWHLAIFYSELAFDFGDNKDYGEIIWTNRLQELRLWGRAKRDSITPQIALA